MAEVMNSLFGITPESLMADRQAKLQAQAMQYAQVDPFQRATVSIYQGANQLGGALGGMLGGQDPELMRLQQRQGTLQGIDLTNPESLKQGIQAAMQNKDYQLVSELTNRYQAANKTALDAEVQRSIITKNTAEKNAAATPAAIASAQRIAALKQAIPAYKAAGDDATVTLLQNELDALTPAEKTINFGAEAERYARQLYSKPYASLSQTEMAKVNGKVEETAKERAPKIVNNIPGVDKAGDVTGLRKDIQAITKPYQDKADAANDAIGLANMAIKTKNFASVASLSRSLSKAAGDQQITAGDVAAFGIDPSLVGTVADTLNRFVKGVPTENTLIQLREVAKVIEAKNKGRIQQEEEQTMNVARSSKLFTEEQIQTVFPRRPKDNAASKTSFNSVADATAAKLPKGTMITINGRRAVVE
jgi:hypothetical protein